MKHRKIVFHSSIESVVTSKVSLIAIFELILMTIVGFWLFLSYGWWWHIFIGLLVSPMFYLRTKESTEKSIEYTNKVFSAITVERYKNDKKRIIIIGVKVILFLFVFFVLYKIIKIGSSPLIPLLISSSGMITLSLIKIEPIDYYKLKKGVNLLIDKNFHKYEELSFNAKENELILGSTSFFEFFENNQKHDGSDESIMYNFNLTQKFNNFGYRYHDCYKTKNIDKCFDKVKKNISDSAKYQIVNSLVDTVLVSIFITGLLLIILLLFKFQTLSVVSFIIVMLMLVPICIFITSFSLSIYLAVIFIVVRAIVGGYFLVISPIESMKAIPKNWMSIAFFQDSLHPPELVPLSEVSEFSNLTYSVLIQSFSKSKCSFEKIVIVVLLSILYIPAWMFRFTMEMGAWLWLPLIWLTQKNTPENSNDDVFLKSESTEFWVAFRLLYSFTILMVFTLLPLVLATRLELQSLQEHALGVIFLFGLTKSWTWVRAVIAVLTIVVFFFARNIRLHRDNGHLKYGSFWIQKLKQLVYIRMILSLFTLSVSLYLVATKIIDWHLVVLSFSNMQFLP